MAGSLGERSKNALIAAVSTACLLCIPHLASHGGSARAEPAATVDNPAEIGLLPVTPTPLTATPFYRAYMDHPAVRAATESQDLSAPVQTVLADPTAPLDLRLAVVNALASRTLPTGFTLSWWQSLGNDVLPPPPNPADGRLRDPRALQPDSALILGYMLSLEDPLRPRRAEPFLAYAVAGLETSLTAHLAQTLVAAQIHLFDGNWCAIWNQAERLLSDEALQRDMRPRAVAIIAQFLGSYEQDCR